MEDFKTKKQTTKPDVQTPHQNDYISIGRGSRLHLDCAYKLAHNHSSVAIRAHAMDAVHDAYQFLKHHVDKRIPIYGINTNFGDQVRYIDTAIKDSTASDYYEGIQNRQENIIRSLSCGLGAIVSPEIIRVTMLLRAHCIAQGHSGVH